MKFYNYPIKTKLIAICFSLFLMNFSNSSLLAQSHTFPVFSPGIINSGNSGVTTAMNTSSLTAEYLIYTIEADFVGVGGAQVAWSITMNAEITDGAGTILKAISHADIGAQGNENATTLKWTGILSEKHIGSNNLSIRFFDDYNDASGPYTSDITNVSFTIHEGNSQHLFPIFSAGEVNSGNTGTTVALPTAGLTGNYLVYVVTADFIGTNGAQGAWSSTIELEINNGAGTVLKPDARAGTGARDDTGAATLTWSGLLEKEHIGSDALSVKFRDDFHDASGPYTSDITNVRVEIYEATNPTDLPIINPGALNSGNSGITTTLNTSGVSGDHLLYVISADFVGTGGAQEAWSSTIQMELNNGGLIYESLASAALGSQDNGSATTLRWAGVMNQELAGGGAFSIRFFDSFNDASGPYTSNISNVNVRLYRPQYAILPIELISFDAKLNSSSKQVDLSWITATEINNDYFNIERTKDGISWEIIEKIDSKGNSSELQYYSAVDREPITGTSYYRLKQTDIDGKFSYSELRQIEISNRSIAISPNPSSSIFNIQLDEKNDDNEYHIQVYDHLGKLLKTTKWSGGLFVLDLSNYSSGFYFVNIDGLDSYKIVKE